MRLRFAIAVVSLATIFHAVAGFCAYAQSPGKPGYQGDAEKERLRDETIAVVNGRKIGKSEIDAPLASQIQSLEQKVYELRRKSLEMHINRLLFEDEARRRGISVEELRRIIVAGVRVEEKEVEDAYNNTVNRYGPAPVSELEARERVRATLESQKRAEALNKTINDLKAASKIELYLKEPATLKTEISGSGPSLGAEGAPVTVAMFTDFQCPYCKKVNDTLKQVVQSYENNVRILYKSLPLPNHPQAFKAAQAAHCADAQGKFWQYHDLLFEHSNDLSDKALKEYAAEVNLKLKDFNACFDSEASRATVMKDVQEARRAGVFSTPTFIINGRMLRGARNLEDFKVVIDQALKERTGQKTSLTQ
jgi:protein-disulfide isomerase